MPSILSKQPVRKNFEFFVDFEFFTNLNVDFEREWPKLEGRETIFMVGVGWEENWAWRFKSFVADTEDHDGEQKLLESFAAFLFERTGGRLTLPTDTALYHWSSAEVWQLRNACKRLGFGGDHALNNLPWYDLETEVFLAEPVGVPEAWGFGLKEISNGLGLVKWPGGLDQGLSAMVAGWKAYSQDRPREAPEMKMIERYNEVDCKALWEIIRWVRRRTT